MTRPDDAGPGAQKRHPEGDGGEAPTGYGEIEPEIDDEGRPVDDHRALAEHLEGHNESAGDSAGLRSTGGDRADVRTDAAWTEIDQDEVED